MLKKIIVMGLVGLFFVFGCGNQDKASKANNDPLPEPKYQQNSQTAARLAPEFALRDHNGNTVRLSDFQGKVIILDFWATWCPPCRQEIPGFIELYNQYRDRGLEIIGIALDQQGWAVVKPFMNEFKINYPIVMGNQRVVTDYGGIEAIPTTFIIDKKGRITEVVVGYHPKSYFEQRIQSLLNQ